jgi:hypothetical protein
MTTSSLSEEIQQGLAQEARSEQMQKGRMGGLHGASVQKFQLLLRAEARLVIRN